MLKRGLGGCGIATLQVKASGLLVNGERHERRVHALAIGIRRDESIDEDAACLHAGGELSTQRAGQEIEDARGPLGVKGFFRRLNLAGG